MARSKKDTKRIIKTVHEWNKPRFTKQEEFCKASLKVNQKKVQGFAAVLSEDLFRPLVNMLGENSAKPLVAMMTGRKELGKVLHLARSAQRDMEAIKHASDNEELFRLQNRLREICSAVVEESVSILSLEGTPFAQGNSLE
ncbi:MAG: hypothetical protein K6F95_01340 [Selenomonas sp.]|uniref:hypothetical protein n=1 Tax=Selenomonas sp. TaxID=2053611 RepID=UPI0025E04D52|nr:hypothetical protein [Selenomonas sp.]MCR5756536.1 hypothetical protein [Selenomonas sp.]